MPRKSNKTAHVLNLLAGQDTTDETENEKAKETESGAARPPAPSSSPSAAPAQPAAAPAQPDIPSNISIVDNGAESDPVAEKIRDELLKSLGEELEDPASASKDAATAPADASAVMPETAPVAEAMSVSETTSVPEAVPVAEPASVSETASVTESQPVPVVQEVSAPTVSSQTAETPSQEETEEILELAEEETPAKEEVPAEPEPDYVILNVMQEVVEDKIIYFMKQFDVCTCDRCRADTIALTLSGLPAQYKVVDKAAVAPLVSYYASRLISQVTVEALKACTEVRENPRH